MSDQTNYFYQCWIHPGKAVYAARGQFAVPWLGDWSTGSSKAVTCWKYHPNEYRIEESMAQVMADLASHDVVFVRPFRMRVKLGNEEYAVRKQCGVSATTPVDILY